MYNGSFYNPYMYTANSIGKTGIGLKGIVKGFNFNNFLTSTGKTLNVINQAIPIFYQIKPIFNNARTMLKVMGAVRESKPKSINATQNTINQNNSSISSTIPNTSTQNITNSNYNNPAFFL